MKNIDFLKIPLVLKDGLVCGLDHSGSQPFIYERCKQKVVGSNPTHPGQLRKRS